MRSVKSLGTAWFKVKGMFVFNVVKFFPGEFSKVKFDGCRFTNDWIQCAVLH